jgi:thioredoxin 1
MSKHVSDVTDSTFEQDVKRSEKPVLVDFWAPWCGPCRQIAPQLEEVAEKYGTSARVVKVNVDDNMQTTQQFGIKGIPTLILFKDGEEKERIVGATSKDVLTRLLDRYVS